MFAMGWTELTMKWLPYKDHKENDITVGPVCTPIIGAMVGPNMGLNENGRRIVKKVAENTDIGLVDKKSPEYVEY